MSVFLTNLFEQRKTVETLIKESRADSDFYLLLSFSAFITALGLHMNNPIVIIGAMLVAPILFPILSLGMGMVTSSKDAIQRSLKIVLKSASVVLIISFITSFLINDTSVTTQMVMASTPNFMFFLVAFFSGIVAAYSWARQTIANTLPGVAITVSLIPPLSMIGVALSLFSRQLLSGSILLFVINLLGIVLASMAIFSLFGFSSMQKWQDEKIKEEKNNI